jgi:Major tropism determinant N-terminal domain
MSLQIRRGTSAQLANITPVTGELIYTTDTKAVFVGDGSTAGGVPVAVGGSGNVSGTNLLTNGIASAGGNVIGGNITTTGQISATGNITGNYLFGNGSALTGIAASSVNANSLTGTVLNSGVVNSSLTSVGTLTSLSASGNITGGNILSGGLISTTGNATNGNVLTGGLISATATITGGNLATGGTASAAGNITGGNLLTGGQVSATGNIRTSAYLFVTQDINVTGDVTATSYTGTTLSLSGNITGGNIRTGGFVSATGNVTGSYIFGNGSQLTGLPATYGNSNVITLLAAFGSNTISTTGTIASGNITGGNILTGGDASATGSVTGGNFYTAGVVSATGNVRGGNLNTGGNISATGAVTAASTVGGVITGSSASVTGTVTAASVVGNVYTNSIVNSGSNATGNIGSSSTYFNTIFATATTALYADLAENYLADADYAPSTVVVFGGEKEITVTTEAADERVAGVISTNPAYLMNSGELGLPVALRGKVPVRVIGPVTKGDSLVTSTTPGVAFSVGRERVYGQAVFAKSLESNDSDSEKVILAVIV